MLFSLVFLQLLKVIISKTSMLAPNDRVLFVGGPNVFMGTAVNHGFINTFLEESNKHLQNITVFNGGMRSSDFNKMFLGIDAFSEAFRPTKVIYMIDYDTSSGMSREVMDASKRNVEHVVVKLLALEVEIILCSVLLQGERGSGGNEVLEEYVGMTAQVAKNYDVVYIDIYTKMCKYLEKVNIDDQHHSVLTVDGSILNEKGHFFVAGTILTALAVPIAPLNPISSEIERIERVRANVAHISKHKLLKL
jgi:hypothetical protein